MIEISKRQTILDVEVITRDTKVLENASKSMVLCPQHGTSISLRIFYFLSCFRLEHVYYQNAKKSIFFCLPVGSQIKCAQTYGLIRRKTLSECSVAIGYPHASNASLLTDSTPIPKADDLEVPTLF